MSMNWEKHHAVVEKEKALARGENLDGNRFFVQIKLAIQIYSIFKGFFDMDEKMDDQAWDEQMKPVMVYWESEGYSEAFSLIEQDLNFQQHKRLKGDITLLMPSDIISFKENGVFPE